MAGSPDYRVEQTRAVLDFIKNLKNKACQAGRSGELGDALLDIVQRLRTDLHSLGEPLRKTKKSGGMIHFAIHLNFAIHFAILEPEKIVMIFGFQTYGAFWN